MALESRYWRLQIKNDIAFIRKKMKIDINNFNSENLDKFFSQIEIKLFITAYAMRKLIDMKKVPERYVKKQIFVNYYIRKNKIPIHPFDLIENRYKILNKKSIAISLRDLCNQFIHSFIFQPYVNSKHRVKNIYFVSDHRKDKIIYSMAINDFLKLATSLIKKYPKNLSVLYRDNGFVVNCE